MSLKTRSGKSYNKMSEPTSPAGMSELMQMLLEDRRRHEEEAARREQSLALAEERARREQEAAWREQALAEERARCEEHALRVKQLQEQMSHMQAWIERSQAIEEERLKRADRREQLTLIKFTESEDIEAYLTTAERMLKASGLPEDKWAYKLAPQLTGRAQQAYAALSSDKATVYKEVKAAILRRYDINEETYRQRFQVATRNEGEAY